MMGLALITIWPQELGLRAPRVLRAASSAVLEPWAGVNRGGEITFVESQ